MLSASGSIDLGSAFWQDVPDSVLQDVYNELGGEGLDFDDEMQDLTTKTPVNANAIPRSAASQGSLPALFPTQSFTDVSAMRPVQHKYSDNTNQTRNIITQITQLYDHQQEQINKMKILQKQIVDRGTAEFGELVTQQNMLNSQIISELTKLRELNKNIVLEPEELHQSRILGQRLQIQQQSLLLYSRELSQLASQGKVDPLSMLVIEDQPIPQVTFKGKALEDNFVVRLLSGAGTVYQNVSKVKAQLVSDERTWKTDKILSSDETTMDFYHLVASFHHLKIEVSTRMSAVFLKFGIQVQQDSGVSPIIQSPPSYPLIVITNESQWCDAAGKLLIMDSFAGQVEICWPQFANGLHHHFLKATRQEPGRPGRCIKPHEFEFIHQKFFKGHDVVTTQQANRFWSWFGQAVQALRFKRHIATLWITGLLYGLITKDECRAALERQEEGTFMIRFSESFPGLFAVAYVSDDPSEIVKHYLVKPDDTGSQKTLPDFLRQKPQFKFLYMFDVHAGTFCKYPKDAVLSSFYSKGKELDAQQSGYVLL